METSSTGTSSILDVVTLFDGGTLKLHRIDVNDPPTKREMFEIPTGKQVMIDEEIYQTKNGPVLNLSGISSSQNLFNDQLS